MSSAIFTYENHNLGDQLVFLNLLRAVAKQSVSRPFVHFCNGCHISQLREVVADLPNIILEPFESPLWRERKHDAVCVWKNHQDAWVKSPLRWDWSAYTLWHHQQIARRLGFESPFTCREHLLFDYPALNPIPDPIGKYDFLIINSEPSSGQFGPMKQHGSGYMDEFISALSKKGMTLVATVPPKWEHLQQMKGQYIFLQGPDKSSVSEIGQLSAQCRHHIMIATGPMWPTLNTHNHHHHEGRRRIVLLDNGENLNMPFIEQVPNVESVFTIAKEAGWI